MITQPPPDDPAWEHIRARYEAGEEKVKAIAEEIGLNLQQLSTRAKALGWKLRNAAKAAKKKVKGAAASAEAALKPETTRATLERLKEMLRQRIVDLEAEVKDIGEEVSALANDKQIKAVNLVVRTLEKVLDLERKDKLKRKQQNRAYRYFDRDQRRALADKIDRLEGHRQDALEALGAPRSSGAEQPVALLGKAGPAAAGGK
jgi:TolA-binding protein